VVGERVMILLTLGTSNYSFIRLVKSVDEALIKSGSKELLVVQLGTTSYNFIYKTVLVYDILPYEKLKKYYSSARAVISHCGAGSVLMSILFTKNKPFVLAREGLMGEHVDDHQQGFLEYCLKKKIVTSSKTANVNNIINYLKRPPIGSRRPSSALKLINSLNLYTSSL
jgi:UDP-N-acetylglucosamine transferase subunit ALG13